jgi:hypothetical protein
MQSTWLFLIALVLGSACGDDRPGHPGSAGSGGSAGAGGNCPGSQPSEGAACSNQSSTCQYLIERCPCGPTDLYWSCSCANGRWRCARGFDCYACDGGVDRPASGCAACLDGEVCVERFDGQCHTSGPECVGISSRAEGCGNGTCTPVCETELCRFPYQCMNRSPCGTEAPGAFTCYGP